MSETKYTGYGQNPTSGGDEHQFSGNTSITGNISASNIVYDATSNSTEWGSSYTTVNTNSGNWDSVYNSVNTTSGNWDNVYTSVNTTSGNWDSVYSTVNSTSSTWSSAGHNHDDRYYTKTELTNGTTTLTLNDLTVQDLTVLGTTFSADVESVLVSANTMTINNGETGHGVTNLSAGILVDRGTASEYAFVFRESDDAFVLGETSGTLQAVATREDVPLTSGIPYWDNNNNQFKTLSPNGPQIQNSGGNLNLYSEYGYFDYFGAHLLPSSPSWDLGAVGFEWGDLFLSGNITVGGTVDGRDVSADGQTLDNHITSASVHFTEGSIDHGSIAGLADDDHTQYVLADGTRAMATLTVNGSSTFNGDIDAGTNAISATSSVFQGNTTFRTTDGDQAKLRAEIIVGGTGDPGILKLYEGASSVQNVEINSNGASYLKGGDFTVDTTTLHVDSTSNRVGIGTITPNEALTVVGDISATGDIHVNGTVDGVDIAAEEGFVNTLQNQMTDVVSTSGNWDSVYTTVNTNSANWDSVYSTVNSTSSTWGAAGHNHDSLYYRKTEFHDSSIAPSFSNTSAANYFELSGAGGTYSIDSPVGPNFTRTMDSITFPGISATEKIFSARYLYHARGSATNWIDIQADSGTDTWIKVNADGNLIELGAEEGGAGSPRLYMTSDVAGRSALLEVGTSPHLQLRGEYDANQIAELDVAGASGQSTLNLYTDANKYIQTRVTPGLAESIYEFGTSGTIEHQVIPELRARFLYETKTNQHLKGDAEIDAYTQFDIRSNNASVFTKVSADAAQIDTVWSDGVSTSSTVAYDGASFGGAIDAVSVSATSITADTLTVNGTSTLTGSVTAGSGIISNGVIDAGTNAISATSCTFQGNTTFRTTDGDQAKLRAQITVGGTGDPGTLKLYEGASSVQNVEITSNGASYIKGGDFTVDTTTFHVDAADNNVGIGTTTPNDKLTVVGNISATGNIKSDGQIWSDHTLTNLTGAGPTTAINWNNGNFQTVDANTATSGWAPGTATNPKAGASYGLKFVQNANNLNITGAWWDSILWPGGTAPTISTADNAVDIITLFYDRTNYYGVYSQDFS